MPRVSLQLTELDLAWLIAGGELTLGPNSKVVLHKWEGEDGAEIARGAIARAEGLKEKVRQGDKREPERW